MCMRGGALHLPLTVTVDAQATLTTACMLLPPPCSIYAILEVDRTNVNQRLGWRPGNEATAEECSNRLPS